MFRIFTYGTLMRGFGNYRRLLEGRATFVKEAETAPEFRMLNLGHFPGIIPGNSVIHGEVFEFTDRFVLRDLDRLEGHPGFYVRTPAILADGTAVELYVLNQSWHRDAREVVTSGDWRDVARVPVPKEG